ncbi:MAG: ComEA family DNA-binding protein [Thiolinea sp.]
MFGKRAELWQIYFRYKPKPKPKISTNNKDYPMKKLLSMALLSVSLFSVSAWAEMVNINQASADVIATNLPGIGEKKAAAIVAYRTEHGEFKTLEDLKQVKGIGDGIFAKIKADISLTEGAVALTTTEGKAGKEGPAEVAEVIETPEKQAKPEKKSK